MSKVGRVFILFECNNVGKSWHEFILRYQGVIKKKSSSISMLSNMKGRSSKFLKLQICYANYFDNLNPPCVIQTF